MYTLRSKRGRGFTLVEILAVVVIIGIASAIVIPNLGPRDDLRVASAARIMVADLIYAQNMAIASQKPVYVKFNVANDSYELLSTASSNGDVLMQHPMTQADYVQTFGPTTSSGLESVSISSAVFNGIDSVNYGNEYTIGFDELGAPYAFSYTSNDMNDLASGTIVLSSGSFTSTITISPYTGEIQVQ